MNPAGFGDGEYLSLGGSRQVRAVTDDRASVQLASRTITVL
jgi:hypothetical protein